MIIHICGGPEHTWRYKGWYFEFHHMWGPTPLKKDGQLRAGMPGRKFWAMWDEFDKLPKEEKRKYEAA
jgi:hypothetical protein